MVFSYQTAGDRNPSRPDKLLLGLEVVAPDHPPASASRRLSGADKKEKQRRQQQRGGEQHPAPKDLLFGSNGNGAAALHDEKPDCRQIVLEIAR